jgi:hypothetical protein
MSKKKMCKYLRDEGCCNHPKWLESMPDVERFNRGGYCEKEGCDPYTCEIIPKPSKAEVMERAIDMMALTIGRGSCKHCPLYGDRKYCAEWSNAKFCDSVIKAHFLRVAKKEKQ